MARLSLLSTEHQYPTVPRLPPPDMHNIVENIQSSVCLDNESAFFILFLVLSHPGNVNQRMLIRNTYPAAEINALGIRRVFVLGTLLNEYEPDSKYASISDAKIRAENDRFSDIIRLNLTENYHTLSFKCLAAFTWAAQHCKHARFIARTDDDIFIDYYSLQIRLNLNARIIDDDEIKGHLLSGDKILPRRNFEDRNYISYEEYPYEKFPDWLTGALYITSPKTIGLLVQAARSVPFFPLEDMYFTVQVAKVAGVRRTDMKDLLVLDSMSANCCLGDEVNDEGIYECQYLAFEQLSGLSLAQAKRIKAHGRFCYLFDCLPFSLISQSTTTNVKCF